MPDVVFANRLGFRVEPESAKILAAAEAHLRSQGKIKWTDEDLVLACEDVMPKLGLDRYPPTIA
jgi:hypothetical protein